MEDNAGKDWKIIAVADRDPRFADLNSIERLEEHLKKEIWHFFETYKQLENKQVKVNGWLNKKESYRIIRESKERFEKES
ncbi:MAG: Inorganic pyrophosphatase [candidate division CPR1 bacterium GW2011_GWC1_49_13]|uniref:inorganic diphosphatase n=1 Tax=candidate division CPR1 bacterium GW2011_GWC1_49_13 TaxID=1618342 RepID=A0A0G1VFS5_9BACT|nr:MAG: Inorganic pyrophosphatase [candidate division CPR1 bacterium GW2011_GWC1_49_13]